MDKDGTPISGQDFGGLIRQYFKSNCFFIEIVIIDGIDGDRNLTEVFLYSHLKSNQNNDK